MLAIHTKNKKIKDSIELLVQIVESYGGYIHSSVIIREVQNKFSVFCKRKITANAEVFRVPFQCMPFLEQFDLTYIDDKIICKARQQASIPEGILKPSQKQIETMEAIINIYNDSEKVVQYSADSSMLAYGGDDTFTALIRLRDSDFVDGFQLACQTRDAELYCYFESRVFKDDLSGGRWLLPLIDFVDHHSFADAFRASSSKRDEGSLTLNYLGVDNGKKCLASYALMDCFQSWIKYGFVDRTSFFVQSVPFSVEIAGKVLKFNARPINTGQLEPSTWVAKNKNSYFYAARFQFENDICDVEFLLIPPVKHLSALNEVLQIYLANLEQKYSLSTGSINNFENLLSIKNELVEQNMQFYRKLYDCINALRHKGGGYYQQSCEMISRQIEIIKDCKKNM